MNIRQRLAAKVFLERPSEIVMTEAEAQEYWEFCMYSFVQPKSLQQAYKQRDKSARLMFNSIPIVVRP